MSAMGRSSGFSLVEVVVAVVILTLIVMSLTASNRYAATLAWRSEQELSAARFLEAETERLRVLPYDSLQSGARSSGRGTATWTVSDSGTFRQVILETRFGSATQGLLVDSVTLFRTP
jgi:prepilin-type N-terminal cleavage/methylation domain-containing protein